MKDEITRITYDFPFYVGAKWYITLDTDNNVVFGRYDTACWVGSNNHVHCIEGNVIKMCVVTKFTLITVRMRNCYQVHLMPFDKWSFYRE